MRLFLSSYRAGQFGGELVRLLGRGARLCVITNAKDYQTNDDRQASVDEVLAYLGTLGFVAEELDLRAYFEGDHDWLKYLGEYDGVWLAGGNTFVLRRALDAAGLTQPLAELVRADKLTYGGESAGAIMATPELTGVQYGDDPDVLPAGYTAATPWQGLGLMSDCLVPHFSSDWDGAAEMVVSLEAAGRLYHTLTDDQVFIVDGERRERLG